MQERESAKERERDNIHEEHDTYSCVGCHILMRGSFKIRRRKAYL